MSNIIITDADLAALAHYPLSLRETARALWGRSDLLPADRQTQPPAAPSNKSQQTGAS